ncbi:MAG TPA: hypothetical protein VFC39_19315 [Acidobacteriaceae bacterium]|nr:hypothetical protein [Acidobacteriaceae bacterium]
MLVTGVDAPGAGDDKLHDLMATQDFYLKSPMQMREHLICRILEKLVPFTQEHDIKGLVMGYVAQPASLARRHACVLSKI